MVQNPLKGGVSWANREVVEQSEGKAVSDFLSPAAPAAHCGHTLDLVGSSPHHHLLHRGSSQRRLTVQLTTHRSTLFSLPVLQAKSNHPGISEIMFERDAHLPAHCKPMTTQFTQISAQHTVCGP